MEDCVFCKIVKGESPSYKIYEDADFLGFLDIHPQVAGHSLIIPKRHFPWVYDVPNFSEYWLVALKVTRAIQEAFQPKFIRYVTYGIHVPHAHIHILPQGGEINETMTQVAKKIYQSL